jgi:hypothetical protein
MKPKLFTFNPLILTSFACYHLFRFLTLSVLCSINILYAQPANYFYNREFVGWSGTTMTIGTPAGGIISNTSQATSAADNFVIEWDGGFNKWYNTSINLNEPFLLTFQGCSCGRPDSRLNSNTTNGKYYTLQIRGLDYTNRNAVMMETDNTPVSFHPTASTAVSTPSIVCPGMASTINVTLAGSKSPQERVFIRYSPNSDFSNSKVVEATGTGSTWSTGSATIPESDNTAGATIRYYAYTTTVAATNTSDHDLITLRFGNNGGLNYSYTVANGWTTAANGNWSSASTWTANAVPSATQNLGILTIAHDVTLNQNATVSSIVINTGSTLTASANTLTINNNTSGTTFTVNGTYTASGNNVVAFTGTATHTISGTVTFQTVTTSTGLSFSANSMIAANNGRFQLNSGGFVTAAPSYAIGSTLIYNNAGLFNRNVEWGASSGRGYPHHVIVQGNTSLDLNTNPISPAELSIGGDLTIGNENGWGKVFMNNSMNKPLYIRGNLTIGNANAASNSSELFLTFMTGALPADFKGDLYLEGNFTRAAGSFFTDNNRATFLLGSNNTTISGASGQTFSYLIIDKQSPTNTVTLSSPVAISQLATFTDGIVISSSSNPFVFQAGSSVSSASFNSFVEGPVEKTGNTDFSFPTGTRVGASERHYRPIRISNLSGSNTYTATFQRLNPYDRGPISAAAKDAGLSVISRCEYWDLTRTTGGQTATITLSWSTNSIGTSKCNVAEYVIPGNETALRVVPFANATASSWGDNFGYNTHSLPDASNNFIGTVSWNMPNTAPNNYQRFVIGSTDWRLNPLPVEIRNFKAIGIDNNVQLSWQVENNDQVKYYHLERSRNGFQFEIIKKVIARRYESVSSYSDHDPTPFSGWGYYRLRITDWQGNSTYSNIQKVWKGPSRTLIQLSPNPVSGILNISIPEFDKTLSISIFHSNGQFIQEILTTNNIERLDVSKYPSGQYYVRITTLDGVKNIPFVKY